MPAGDFHQHSFTASNETPVTWTTSHATFRDKTQTEIMNERADLAARLAPFVSQRWLMTEIFGFSEEEAEKIEFQRRREATEMPAIGGPLAPLPGLAEMKQLALGVDHAEDDDIAYFKRNLMKALRVPDHFMGPRSTPPVHTVVGPNDYLVVHVKTDVIPPNKVEDYLKWMKKAVRKVFIDAPFVDRMIFVAGAKETGFSSIRVETQEDRDRETQIHAMHAYAKENSYWIDGTRLTNGDIEKAREILRRTQKGPRKTRPPIM